MLEREDTIPTLMEILRQVPPSELLASAGFARRGHGAAFWVVKELVELGQSVGIDLTPQLLSCGYVDIMLSALNALEQQGADVNGFVTCFGILQLLKVVDGEGLPQIEAKLRAAPSTLRYIVDCGVGIAYMKDLGFHGGAYGTIIAANLFAKDEANSFGFVRECNQHVLAAPTRAYRPHSDHTRPAVTGDRE